MLWRRLRCQFLLSNQPAIASHALTSTPSFGGLDSKNTLSSTDNPIAISRRQAAGERHCYSTAQQNHAFPSHRLTPCPTRPCFSIFTQKAPTSIGGRYYRIRRMAVALVKMSKGTLRGVDCGWKSSRAFDKHWQSSSTPMHPCAAGQTFLCVGG